MGAAAVPSLISAGGMLASKFMSKPPKLAQPGQAAQAGLTGLSSDLRAQGTALGGVGNQLVGAGQAQVNQAAPGMQAAANYYRTLVQGSPGALAAATAPEVGAISSVYRGASRSLDRAGVAGGNREVAEGELARQRAGQVGGLVLGQRPLAAEGLARVTGQQQAGGLGMVQSGAGVLGAGVDATRAAGGPLSAIYGMENNRAFQQGENQRSIGNALAGLLAAYLQQRKGGAPSAPATFNPPPGTYGDY